MALLLTSWMILTFPSFGFSWVQSGGWDTSQSCSKNYMEQPPWGGPEPWTSEVVFSPSPGAPTSICGGSWVEEQEFESHTDLVPLFSDCVTLGKVE